MFFVSVHSSYVVKITNRVTDYLVMFIFHFIHQMDLPGLFKMPAKMTLCLSVMKIIFRCTVIRLTEFTHHGCNLHSIGSARIPYRCDNGENMCQFEISNHYLVEFHRHKVLKLIHLGLLLHLKRVFQLWKDHKAPLTCHIFLSGAK